MSHNVFVSSVHCGRGLGRIITVIQHLSCSRGSGYGQSENS